MADRSKSKFGRRRPYMLAGSFLCFGALLLLGFTSPFASFFVGSDNELVCQSFYSCGEILVCVDQLCRIIA